MRSEAALTGAGLAALLIVLVSSWLMYPGDLHWGLDGSLYTFTLSELARWSSYFDQFVFNPYQGAGTVFLTSNIWFNPGHLVFASQWSPLAILMASYGIYAAELYLSTVFLGRALRLPIVPAVLSAQLLCMILFPPFLTLTSLYGMFVLIPGLAHVFALGNVAIGSVVYIGGDSTSRNVLIVALLSFVAVYLLFCEPLFSVTFLVPAMLFYLPAAAALAFSKRKLAWLCLAAAIAGAVFLALDGYAFIQGAFLYSARTVFTNEIYGDIQNGAYAFLPFQRRRTLLMFLALLCGCIMGYRSMGRPLRPLFLAVFLQMIAFLGLSLIFLFTDTNLVNPMPVYLEMSSYALFIIAAAHGAWAFVQRQGLDRLPVSGNRLSRLVLVSAVPLSILLLFLGEVTVRGFYPPAAEKPHSVIVDQLVSEIGIAPGSLFRGSAVSVFGVSGGPLARHLGYPDDAPFDKWVMIKAAAELSKAYDNSHTLADLWKLGIPTLEEYSPLVSPFFYVTISRLLSRPHDYQSRNLAIVTKPDPKILAALGVRFLLTDMNIDDRRVALRTQIPLAGNVSIRLYELARPNLATFSPVRVYHVSTAAETLSLLRSDTFSPDKDVVVYEARQGPFVPVASSRMFFERGGVRVVAASTGRSLLLLPLQFSHCFRRSDPSAAGGSGPEVMRANIAQTAVIFDRDLDLRLEFEFGLGHAACRLLDIDDVERLQLKELAGEVGLPPGLHPYSLTKSIRPAR